MQYIVFYLLVFYLLGISSSSSESDASAVITAAATASATEIPKYEPGEFGGAVVGRIGDLTGGYKGTSDLGEEKAEAEAETGRAAGAGGPDVSWKGIGGR